MHVQEVKSKDTFFGAKKTSLGFKVTGVEEEKILEVKNQLKDKHKMNIEPLKNESMKFSYFK